MDGQERRKHPRFPIDLPIEYSRMEAPSPQTGRAVNVSEGGLLLSLPERVEIGQRLRIKLFPTPAPWDAMEMPGEVVWVESHGVKKQVRCGVRFFEVSPENQRRLKSFLKSMSK